MQRHRFDPISFVFGLGFTAAAAWALLSDGDLDLIDGRWVWPSLLIFGGLLLLGSMITRGQRTPTPEVGFMAATDASDTEEADRLEAAKAELPDDPFSRPGS